MTSLFNLDVSSDWTVSSPTVHIRLVAGDPPVLQQMWEITEIDHNYTRKSYHEWRNVEIVEAPKE